MGKNRGENKLEDFDREFFRRQFEQQANLFKMVTMKMWEDHERERNKLDKIHQETAMGKAVKSFMEREPHRLAQEDADRASEVQLQESDQHQRLPGWER